MPQARPTTARTVQRADAAAAAGGAELEFVAVNPELSAGPAAAGHRGADTRPLPRPARDRHAPRPTAAAVALAAALLLTAGAVALPCRAAVPPTPRCIDEDSGAGAAADSGRVPAVPGAAGAPTDASLPRLSLQSMVREAIRRSQAIGAARLLAEAAAADVDEARAAARPQAGLSGLGGLNGTMGHNVVDSKGAQVRATFNVGAPLYDAGRIEQLTGWRKNLYEAARQGQLSQQDQIALQTVSLALERSRYRLQTQVYQQYARKMSCLVDALQVIVTADKGRTSELVQARKTVQQAELARSQSESQVKQVEVRLQRFIGDALPSGEGMASLLLEVPPLETLVAEAERAAEIVQLDAQAQALDSYSRAVAASQKPQVNWVVSGSTAVGSGSTTSVTAGLSFNLPLLQPGSDAALLASAKRAEAARLQRADALEARRNRLAEVHEQATSAFDRARQTVEVVRNSDRVRNYTVQQWQQLGKRSLFDVMSAESEHYNLRVAYVNALHDGEQATALLRSLGLGISVWLE